MKDLVDAAEKLCNSLEIASQNELRFCYDLCLELERMSWEALRMRNDLIAIKEDLGI